LLEELVLEARRVVEDWRARAAEGRARYEARVKVATRAHRLMVTTRLCGRRGQGSKTENEAKSKAEPSDDAENREHHAARAHNELLSDLLRHGGAAKREADERFFRTLHPPTKGDDE
jgi:hypothetical protein